MTHSNIEILRKETCLKIIENSIDSKLFNSVLARYKDGGAVVDILNDGEFSCAFFVSGVLTLMQAMDRPHATVAKLKALFEADADWHKVAFADREPGDVIFYEKMKFDDGTENAHVGFVLTHDEAVSTDYVHKVIARHPVAKRPVETIYRYSWPPLR